LGKREWGFSFSLFPSSPLPLQPLPLHGAFLGRINFRLFIDWKRLVEEKSFDVIEQEILGVGTG